MDLFFFQQCCWGFISFSVVLFQGPLPAIGLRGSCLPVIFMGLGGAQLMGLLHNLMSTTTWTSHGKHWSGWLHFVPVASTLDRQSCKQATLDLIVEMWSQGLSFLLAKKNLAEVAFLLKRCGAEDVTKDFIVKQLLKGFQRESIRKDSRRPVSVLLP